jgi:hypothetical protein
MANPWPTQDEFMAQQKESSVSENGLNRGRRSHGRVAGAKEVSNFARKHRISREQAERIIRRARGNRERAEAIFTLVKKEFLVA